MTTDHLHWLALISLGSAVSLYLCARSRRVPALRPAAVACALFTTLDAVRAWGLPPLVDVAVFCAMPGAWMGLLVAWKDEGPSGHPPSPLPPSPPHAAWGRPVVFEAPDVAVRRYRQSMGRLCFDLQRTPVRLLGQALPLAACLLYAVALLALRHRPAVLAHWVMLLQMPRAVAFGWALAVALRGRLTPSARIGPAMALGGGMCVAGGLWGEWSGVRWIAALAWIVVTVLGARAR